MREYWGHHDEVAAAMMPPLRHRMARMGGWARRVVLGYFDADPQAIEAVLAQIAGYDRDHDLGLEYPGGPFDFAVRQSLDFGGDLVQALNTVRVPLTESEWNAGTRALVDALTPAAHRDQAAAILQEADGGQLGETLASHHGDGAPVLCAASAAGAWLMSLARFQPSREQARLIVVRQIRELDAIAIDAPADETLLDITDEAAIAFLDDLLGLPDGEAGAARIPRDPRKRTLAEHDMIALAKQHLLEHPVTSADQREQLLREVVEIITAASGTRPATTTSPRPRGPRTQPKRTTRRDRRG